MVDGRYGKGIMEKSQDLNWAVVLKMINLATTIRRSVF